MESATVTKIDRANKLIMLLTACYLVGLPAPARGITRIIHLEADYIVSPNDVIDMLADNATYRKIDSFRNSLIGKKAPPLQVEEWLVAPHETTAWPNGKFTFLYFWNIYCGICKGQLTKTCELAARVEAKGGNFISIHSYAQDDEIAEIRQVLEKNNINFCVALDRPCKERIYWHSKTFAAFGAAYLPTYLSIGADGRILSYKSPEFVDWEEIIKGDVKNQPDPIKEIRTLIVTPLAWTVDNAEPDSDENQRFLLYRPDTPGLRIKTLRSDNPKTAIKCTKHSGQGQTVFELIGNTTASLWCKVIKGMIFVEVEYGDENGTLEIPFTIASKPLLDYNPYVYFGIAEKSKEIVKNINLGSNVPRENLKLHIIHTPSGITAELPELLGIGCGKIPIQIRFQTSEVGTCRGVIKLKAAHKHAYCEQLIELNYTAIVHD